MEWTWNFLLWIIIIYSPILVLVSHRRKSGSRQLPPGPPGWPLFGHMFKLGTVPHRTIGALREQYGPVVWLRIGSINAMAILSAKAAAEFFKNHDLSFADRNIIETMKSHEYYKGSMALAPYGTYWRLLRRICTVEMFVNKRINETVAIRRRCVDDLLSWIEKETDFLKEARHGIQVTRYVFLASFNMVGNLLLSTDLVDPQSKRGSEFFTAMMGVMEWGGHPNISDAFPWLKLFDLQGLRKKNDRDMGKTLHIASGYVKERLKERQAGVGSRNDFLDVLLDFEGSGKDEVSKLSEHEINVFITEMFLAGSETTSNSIEWALAELLCNPEAMMKVKAELDRVVGANRKFEESDIDNCPYLQAMVKESLRLHPPLPFLVPRKNIQDTNFMGYDIPKNTQVFVNAWAIGRDPECWEDPLSFKPERFLGSTLEFKGLHFEFIPFGAGRRICVGLPLAHRLLHFFLGSLLHQFDWELDSNVTPETLDMTERMGMVVRKAVPLLAVPRKRVV